MIFKLLRYKSKLPFDLYREVLRSYRHILPELDMQRVQDLVLAAPIGSEEAAVGSAAGHGRISENASENHPDLRVLLLQASPQRCTMRAKQVPTGPSFTEDTPREELIHRIHAYIELLPTSELLPLAQSLQKSVAPLFENDGTCPHCGSENTVKNGWRHGKQAYICRDCKKTFVSTTGTIRHRSHQTTDVWIDAIADTKNGLSLQKSSDRIGLCKEAIMEMRHKIRDTMDQDGSLTKPKRPGSAESTGSQTESETKPTQGTET